MFEFFVWIGMVHLLPLPNRGILTGVGNLFLKGLSCQNFGVELAELLALYHCFLFQNKLCLLFITSTITVGAVKQ